MSEQSPGIMRAIGIEAPGGPDALVPVERPIPEPGNGEVLIKVAAAGVNRPDVFQRLGVYPPPPGASDIPGLEVAGTVVEIGPGVEQPLPGDQVCALLQGGGYAEYALAPAALCLAVPRGQSLVEAAAIPETFFTVWSNVFDRAGLRSGESFLVHGGTSGIGTTAIQLARSRGATVYATAGSAEKCRYCEELGAARAVNYREEDFVKVLLQETRGKGVDVILDMVAGEYLPRDIAVSAPDGRIMIIAFLGGTRAEVDFRPVMVNRLTLSGSTLRARSVEFKAAIAASLLGEVWPLLESGTIRPVVDRSFSLEEAAAAHTLMESSRHIGKIMLTI